MNTINFPTFSSNNIEVEAPKYTMWEDSNILCEYPNFDRWFDRWNDVRNILNDVTVTNNFIGVSEESIEKVIFNPPATVVYFKDGSKVVVKTTEDDVFNPEVGLAMAIVKRIFGSRSNYKKFINKFIPEDDETTKLIVARLAELRKLL